MDMRDIAAQLRAKALAAEAEAKAARKALAELEQSGVLVIDAHANFPTSDEFAKVGMTEGIKRILQEAGRPMSPPEIWDGLERRGLRSGSRYPVNTVGSALRQAKKSFKPLGDGTWTLTDENSPQI